MALFKWQLKPDSAKIPDVISNIVLIPPESATHEGK